MECPKCHENVNAKKIKKGAWKKRYECPNCGTRFSKRTFLNKATRFTANVALLGILGDVVGDGQFDGNSSPWD